mmetsp:Transcript_36834/g.68596  ORF Transcript_36834/g.68596 Transcript_36834/m.68596 type:complete len:246 (-) Transcript_36834:476-1213(-)
MPLALLQRLLSYLLHERDVLSVLVHRAVRHVLDANLWQVFAFALGLLWLPLLLLTEEEEHHQHGDADEPWRYPSLKLGAGEGHEDLSHQCEGERGNISETRCQGVHALKKEDALTSQERPQRRICQAWQLEGISREQAAHQQGHMHQQSTEKANELVTSFLLRCLHLLCGQKIGLCHGGDPSYHKGQDGTQQFQVDSHKGPQEANARKHGRRFHRLSPLDLLLPLKVKDHATENGHHQQDQLREA